MAAPGIKWDDEDDGITWDAPAPAATAGIKWDAPAESSVKWDDDPAPNLNARLDQQNPWFGTAMKFGSGEALREFAGSRKGVQQAQDITAVERTQGVEVDEDQEGIASKTLKFGANVLAGAAGVVASPIVFGAQVLAAAGRELGEGAARLAIPLGLSGLPPEHLARVQKSLADGELSWGAHGKRMGKRSLVGIRGLAEGFSPVMTAVLLAPERGEDPLEAAMVSIYNEPVENLIGPGAMLKGAAKIGGKSRTSVVELPTGKTLSTLPKNIRGVPLELNEVGWKAYDATPDRLKPFLWDTEPTRKRAIEDAVTGAQEQSRKSRSQAGLDAKRFMHDNDAEVGAFVAEVKQQFDDAGIPMMPHDIKDIVEGSYHGGKTGITKTVTTASLDQVDNQARGVLQKSLIESGLPDGDTNLVLAYVDRLGAQLVDDAASPVPSTAADFMAHADIGSGAKKARMADVYTTVDNALYALPAAEKATYGQALGSLARKLETDAQWIAFAETPWQSKDGQTFYKPRGKGSVDATSFDEAYGKVLAAESAQARAAGFDKQTSMPVSQLGELHKTYTFDLFQKLTKNMDGSPEGKARVLYALRSDPLVRFTADATASPVARWVAGKLNEPTGIHMQMRQTLRALQTELADNQGVDPIAMAQHFDQYFSHALRQAAETQVELSQDFTRAQLAAAGETKSPRFKRQLSPDEHAQWFDEMANEGKLNVHDLVRFTLDNTANLAQRMKGLSENERIFREAGILADTQLRPDWVQVTTGREATKGKAASGDPYNFIFGKMAGKWVAPEVAHKLDLLRHEYGKTVPIFGIWKLAHTVYNPFGYQQTNHMGDIGSMWAATGISPFSPRFRKQQLASITSLERLHGFFKQGELTKREADPLLIEAMERDVVRLGKVAAVAEAQDTPLGKANVAYVDLMRQVVEKDLDPMVGSAMLGRLQVYADAGKGFIPYMGAAWDSSIAKVNRLYRAFVDEYVQQRADVAPGAPETGVPTAGQLKPKGGRGAVVAALIASPKLLDQAYLEMKETSIVRWTALQENQRRLTLYRLGREELKLSPDDAAHLVDQTLNYGGDWPDWLQRFRSTKAGQLAQMSVAPFATYAVHQAVFTVRRALNEPRMWGMSLLVDGMAAMDQDRQIEAEPRNDFKPKPNTQADFAAQLQVRALSAFGAGRLYLGNNKDMADAFHDLGFGPKFVQAVAHGNLVHTLSLRNIANLNTALQRAAEGQDSEQTLSRMSPVLDAVFTAMDPDSASEAQGPGTMPGNADVWDRVAMGFKRFTQLMVPSYGLYQIGQSATAAAGLITGKADTSGKSGAIVGKAEIMRAFSPSLNISVLDKDNLLARLNGRLQSKLADNTRRMGQHLMRRNPVNAEDAKVIGEGKVALWFDQHLAKMNAVRIMQGRAAIPESHFEELQARKKAALEQARAKSPVNLSLQGLQSEGTIGAIEEAVDEIWEEADAEGTLDPGEP